MCNGPSGVLLRQSGRLLCAASARRAVDAVLIPREREVAADLIDALTCEEIGEQLSFHQSFGRSSRRRIFPTLDLGKAWTNSTLAGIL